MDTFGATGSGISSIGSDSYLHDLCIPPEQTKDRHPASQRFHELLKEIGELHDQKQASYGKPGDPFANVRSSSDWGMPAWVGAMVRATDKVKRLQTLATQGTLTCEPARDAFKDLAVYALIGLVLFDEEQAANKPNLTKLHADALAQGLKW